MKILNVFKEISFSLPAQPFVAVGKLLQKRMLLLLILVLTGISILSFVIYLNNGLGLAYNDARSHLDIGRRVVENLKPGFAQLGSVWLPLPHILMIPTVWNDFFWHTGLSGALQSMISFVVTGVLVYAFLRRLGAGMLARLVGVFVFVANINVLYLQSTAMTELLLLATMTAGVYDLLRWERSDKVVYLVRSAFWIMLSSLIRYDGWFLFMYASSVIALVTYWKKGLKEAEGKLVFFCTLAMFGILAWFVWNYLIFNDPLYFAFGPFSAHAQQDQLEQAGQLITKGNMLLSLKAYFYALAYNSNMLVVLLGIVGGIVLAFDKKIKFTTKVVLSCLFAPFLFNVLALYLGHSVLFVQGILGDTWFNVRYGIMLAPTVAVMVGYLFSKAVKARWVIVLLVLLVTAFTFLNHDAVTIDDARFGSSQKNVTEVSTWLQQNASNTNGFVLISAASHDAIIFSSKMPMKRFIHEGTGRYWTEATTNPTQWARWIIMRTNDNNDSTFRLLKTTNQLQFYELKGHYPFADIYEIKPEYEGNLQTEPIYY